MPTARSTGTVYRTWSYLRCDIHMGVRVPRLCVVQQHTPSTNSPKESLAPPKKFKKSKPEFSGLIDTTSRDFTALRVTG